MALASNTRFDSPTALSESPVYNYQYSSISDATDAVGNQYYLKKKEAIHVDKESIALAIKGEWMGPVLGDRFWLLNTDATSLFREYSPTLEGLSHVYRANTVVKSNKPVGIGFSASVIGWSVRRNVIGQRSTGWNPPLSIRLVPVTENKNAFVARQVNELLQSDRLPFKEGLVVNSLDSNHCSPEYIVGVDGQPNLVNIIRMASNRNVWKAPTALEIAANKALHKDGRGSTLSYKKPAYKLSESGQWDIAADEQGIFCITLANGRCCEVRLSAWRNMKLRSKRGHNMKDKAFTLVKVDLLDARSLEPVFKRSMWLLVTGKRRNELTLEEIYHAYRQRFDIEFFFRFGKQRLLMDDSQTPDKEHLENWMELVGIAYWLIFIARKEAGLKHPKWHKYLPEVKQRLEQASAEPTPSEAQRELERIILGFEKIPFLPKTVKKSEGRQKGDKQEPRKRYEVIYKSKKKPKAALKK